MHLSFWRVARIVSLLVALYVVVQLYTFTSHQSRFQKHLTNQYITWDDFPPEYAERLRSHNETDLLRPSLDYNDIGFPKPDPTGTKSIPPIIHFIWFQNLYKTRPEVTDIPSVGSNAPQLCREYNPDYEIITWNATGARQLLEDHYAWFIPTYDAYQHPIQRIDAFKYFVLWHYGGVYMDMDIACRRPLDPLLHFPAWFPEASPLGVNNDLMATRAGHPAVKLMLESLSARNLNLIFPYVTIFWSTGPQFTGDLLKRWFLQHTPSYKAGQSKKEQDISSDEWFVLPQVFYSEEYTFFGHRPGGTWHGDDVAVVLWFVAHPLIFWTLVLSVVGACIVLLLRRARVRRIAAETRKDLEA